MTQKRFVTRLLGATCVALFASAMVLAQQLQYPATKKVDHVDTYHGTKVPDPYRWLEDDNSPETIAWVEAQNKVTFPYLERIAFRQQLQTRVKALNDYEKYSAPSRKGRTSSSGRTTACRIRACSTSRRASMERRKC